MKYNMKKVYGYEDFINENLYTKALATDSKGWKKNFDKFIKYMHNGIKHNEIKNVKTDEDNDNIITFTIRGRKCRISEETMTLWKKTSGEPVEVEIPISKSISNEIHDAIKNRVQSRKAKKINKRAENKDE